LYSEKLYNKKLVLNIRKKLVEDYIKGVDLYGGENSKLRKIYLSTLEVYKCYVREGWRRSAGTVEWKVKQY